MVGGKVKDIAYMTLLSELNIKCLIQFIQKTTRDASKLFITVLFTIKTACVTFGRLFTLGFSKIELTRAKDSRVNVKHAFPQCTVSISKSYSKWRFKRAGNRPHSKLTSNDNDYESGFKLQSCKTLFGICRNLESHF